MKLFTPASHLLAPAIEPLESRIAPAAVLPFTDVDGDTVKIVASGKATAANLTAAAHFAGGQLTLLDLRNAAFTGSSVSITVTKLGAAPGDGRVNVGEIDATGVDLGAVTVGGDLGKILAGSGQPKGFVKSLTVDSLGVLGTATGAPDLGSNIVGNVGAIKVQSDLAGGLIINGNAASITVGGSLVGGSAGNSGSVFAHNVGAVKIGGDIRGGSNGSAGLFSCTKATSFSLGGSILGGTEINTGVVYLSTVGGIKIGGSIRGGSGTSLEEGDLSVDTKVSSVTIAGSIVGGSSNYGGRAVFETVGTCTVGGSVIGGAGPKSGGLVFSTKIGSLKVGGDFVGGSGESSGLAYFVNAGSIFVGGSLLGGSNSSTGLIEGTTLGTVMVGGSIRAGAGTFSGTIVASTIGALSVGGDVIGASILVGGNALPKTNGQALAIKSLTVGGSVENAKIVAGGFTNPDVQIGAVVVHGDWIASSLVDGAQNLGSDNAAGGTNGAADNVNFGDGHDFINASGGSATIVGSIASITIGGQVRGTPNSVSSSDHFGFVAELIGPVKVGGFLIPLPAGPGNDNRGIGKTLDVNIEEV